MKNLMFIFIGLVSVGVLAQSKMIKGKVFNEGTSLQGANITILDKDIVAVSAFDGSYSIQANEGDILQFSYVGFKTVEILVEDVTDILNITLYAEVNELDEVTVTERAKKVIIETQRDYDENKTYLQTAFGMSDLSKKAGIVRFLQGDKVRPGSTCILNVLQGYFPNVTVFGDCIKGGGIQIRGFNSIIRQTFAIYDVDGVIFLEPPLWIIPTEIRRIAVLPGIAASALYGTNANGGVIVINTRNAVFLEDGYMHPKYDTARVTNNIYSNDAVASESLQKTGSTYLEALKQSKTSDEAKKAYTDNRKSIGTSYFFVLDAFDYFLKERKDIVQAKLVLQDNDEILNSNPVALKALAYSYEASGYSKEAHQVYKEVFMLRPQYAQSYFDLARSYRALGDYQKAASMLVRYDHLVANGFLNTNEHFSFIVDRELNNLLQLEGDRVVSIKKKKKYVLEDAFVGTRLVFEWADSEAEFDLQFVNPENRYSTWEHTLNDNAERIQEEKRIGYNVEEYLIDEALKGTWQINITYKGNKKLTPTYLKATVYYNYGSRQQSKEIKVFKLQSKGMNQNLMTIQNGSMVVVR